mmetsp:Transcript_21572/g.59804  ORF Transcript_21572/g.59804 Transcript_21572/m.59804 type:complete len:219 (+) Transcript_21572:204-860(+)
MRLAYSLRLWLIDRWLKANAYMEILLISNLNCSNFETLGVVMQSISGCDRFLAITLRSENVGQPWPCSIIELSCPFVPVCIRVLAVTMHFILLPFTFIGTAIRPCVLAIALVHAILPLSVVTCATGICEFAMACYNVFLEVTLVHICTLLVGAPPMADTPRGFTWLLGLIFDSLLALFLHVWVYWLHSKQELPSADIGGFGGFRVIESADARCRRWRG